MTGSAELHRVQTGLRSLAQSHSMRACKGGGGKREGITSMAEVPIVAVRICVVQ